MVASLQVVAKSPFFFSAGIPPSVMQSCPVYPAPLLLSQRIWFPGPWNQHTPRWSPSGNPQG